MNLTLVEIEVNNRLSEPGFQSQECMEMYDVYSEYYNKIGYIKPWIGYFILDGDVVKGVCGFTGAPKDGKVEIAYHTFAAYEGQGVATLACSLLINIAESGEETVIITAKTAPEHNISTRILQKYGFEQTEIVQDHEIGKAWFWELK
jgi:[ribosomal protein S5]-alanine N-acetyltransferase